MAVKAADEREERKESVVLLSISSHSNHHQPQIVASSINIKQKLNEPGNVDDVDFSPASKSTAPDGGWRAWMVCVASFYCNGAMFGVMNSAGVIYVKLQEHFPTEKDDSFRLSLVGSLALGSTFLLSTVASILTDKFGIRTVAFTGSVLVVLGMMLSSFANSLDILYVTNGVMFGAGAALVYSPSLVILGHYFKKRLGIVNGIVSSGSSLFTIVSPLLLNELLSKFGLSITYRILAALMFPVMLCTLVFKPLVLVPRQTNPDSTENDGKRVCCSKNGWRKVINISIWKNKKYLVWAIAFPASLFGYFVPLTHLVNHVKGILPKYNGEVLITYFGAASFVGRLLCGAITDIPKVNKVLFQQVSFICLGVLTMLLAAANEYWMLIVICLGLGMFDGCFISLLGPIAFEIVGVKGASQAIGFLLGICSVPITLGPPIAGWIYDTMNKNYKLAFVAAGVSPIVGAILMTIIFFVKQDNVEVEAIEKKDMLLQPSITTETVTSHDDDSNDVWKVMTDKPSLDSASSIQNSNNVENSKQLNAENDRSNVLIERETTN